MERETTRNDTTRQPELILATTTHGAYREQSDGNDPHPLVKDVTHAGFGKTFIEDSYAGKKIGNLWNAIGLNCSTISSPQMQELLWKKLAANCVINPLTAIFQCTNGELLLNPSFPSIQHRILQEIAIVAAQMLERNDNHPEMNATQAPSVDILREFVDQVIQDTRANKSSMYQDILLNRRPEIDHLNGYIVKKGREVGLDCPMNQDICHSIMKLHS
jgi:2-dehydropantoate 2-reductase